MRQLTAGLHGRITVVVSIFATLIGLSVMTDFGSTRQGTDTNAILVIGIAIVGAIAMLVMLALRLDKRYPTGSFFEAALRLLTPLLVLLAGTSWVIENGIFDGSDQAFLRTFAIAAMLVAATWVLIGRTPSASSSTPSNTAVTGERRSVAPLATTSLPSGPPQWPDTPPTAWADALPQSPSTHPTPTQLTPTQVTGAPDHTPQPVKRPKTHRITSGLITVFWVPFGLLVLFLVNYCPDDGTADAVFVLSLIYVAVQLVGNAAAGWILDLRFGNRGGTLLSIGRSVLIATVLLVVVGYFLGALAPDGQSRYCG